MHTGNILKISADAAGKLILTGSLDKTAKLWDAESGRLIKTFRIPIGAGNEGIIDGNAISPDGKTVALGGQTGYEWDKSVSVYIFDVSSGAMKRRLKELPDINLDLVFSPSGEYLVVTMARDKGIRIFRTSDWSMVKSFDNYGGACNNAAFDQSGRLATVSYDGRIRLYSAEFEPLKSIKISGDKNPASLSFTPDGNLLAVGFRDADNIQVFDGNNLKLLYEPDITGTNLNTERLVMVCFSGDGQKLAAAYSYQKKVNGKSIFQIRTWSDKGKGAFTDFPAGKYGIMDIQRMGDNSFLFSGGGPDFGVINPDGTSAIYKAAEIYGFQAVNTNITYSIKDKAGFKINKDGSQIGVTPFGGTALTFSVQSRKLSIGDFSDGSSPADDYSGITISDWTALKTPKINSKPVNFLDPNERALSVDISNDAERIVFGGDFNIYCTDVKGRKIWTAEGQSAAMCVNISGDGKVVLAGMGDGTLRWYKMEDGTLLFSLFIHPDNKRWVLWSPKGYFDCSPGAEDLVGWHVNQGPYKEALFYPLSRFAEQYFVPGLGMKVLNGENIFNLVPKSEIAAGFKKPPAIRIVTPADGITSPNAQCTITVEVTDQGDGIDEIRLYQNDKLIDGTVRGFKPVNSQGSTGIKTFTISLVNGVNVIRATALNYQRTESNPVEIRINYNGSQANSNMYVLAIGVNKYQNPKYSLNYAVKDADAFRDALLAGSKSIFASIDVTSIRDAEATKTSILAAVDKIKSKAQPQDVFVLYYAGHGVMSSGNASERSEFYLVPFNVTKLYEADDMLREKAISAKEVAEFSKQIKAQKQLFVIDACQSGGAMQSLSMRGAAEEKAISQLARSTGTFFIAASGTEQYATEVGELGHGIFTYSVIEALKGICKTQDGKVTVNMLKSCVEDKVPELTQKYHGQPQYPTGYGFGQDFPISVVK